MAALNVAVLISGRGSNMQALVHACREPESLARVACVISNDPEAKGLDWARAQNIPVAVVNHKTYGADRGAFDRALDAEIKKHDVQLVCLAGFMRLLTPWFVDVWRDRLVNIHPSLLPAFPGLHVQRKAVEYGARVAGCTVHFVRAEMDHGPIIAQAAVPVLADDTEETLAERILRQEHILYPRVVSWIAQGRVNVHGEKCFILGEKEPEGFICPVVAAF